MMILLWAPIVDGQRMNPRFKADAMLKPMRELYGSLRAMYPRERRFDDERLECVRGIELFEEDGAV